jgi:hypothetical protein
MGVHTRLPDWLRKRIKFDQLDRKLKDPFSELLKAPATRDENADMYARIARGKKFLNKAQE